jgi:thioredoxin 1
MMGLNQKRKYFWVAFAALALAGLCVTAPSGAENKAAKTPPPVTSSPLLVDVGAKKCTPCKMMAPILEGLRKEYEGVFQVEFIDVWENPGAGEKYGIRGIPTQIFYDASGKEFYRHMGYFSKEQILDTFKKHGIVLKKASK